MNSCFISAKIMQYAQKRRRKTQNLKNSFDALFWSDFLKSSFKLKNSAFFTKTVKLRILKVFFTIPSSFAGLPELPDQFVDGYH